MSRPRGLPGAATAAAAVLCVCATLAGCGSGGSDDGYVAIGAGSPGVRRADLVPPGDGVVMVPLDGQDAGGKDGAGEGKGGPGSGAGNGGGAGARARGTPSGAPGASGGSAEPGGSGGGSSVPVKPSEPSGPSGPSSPSGPSAPGRPPNTPPGPPAPDPGPAELTFGEPGREPAQERWCERVTVTFRNIGGRSVTRGTVTFGTHVIGALGIDWATIHSERKLPVPLAPGAREARTWTICVEAWRVPLGMHVETRDVSVDWT